jgi:hypothetical protein
MVRVLVSVRRRLCDGDIKRNGMRLRKKAGTLLTPDGCQLGGWWEEG